MVNKLAASELVLNPDGSVYHLNLQPEDIAEKILLVGDEVDVLTSFYVFVDVFNDLLHKRSVLLGNRYDHINFFTA